MNKGEIILYQTPDGTTKLDVKVEQDNVWLTQAQMADLFQKDRTVITRHINNVFKEGELEKESNVHFLHFANSDKPVAVYSLDVIISVGYRVKSLRGTQFCIWANKVLKEYLIKGYAVKDTIRLKQYEDLKQTIRVLSDVLDHKTLEYSEATGLLRVITDYTYALDTLDRYDYQQLETDKTTDAALFTATYENAVAAIEELRKKFGGSTLSATRKTAHSKAQ